MKGLLGKKLGMTQVYDDAGRRVAVTVIEAGPCVVVQRKTRDTDGYDAVQLGFEKQLEQRVNRPSLARYKKVGASPCKHLREFRIDADDETKAGDTVDLSVLEGATHVDISGTTKGRGFQGAVKRHNMAGGRMTHGGHSKRRVGSIGQCSYPARVMKGQRMPGHMGNVRRTRQNLKVIMVRGEENLLLVQGAVPGPTGGIIEVKRALKK